MNERAEIAAAVGIAASPRAGARSALPRSVADGLRDLIARRDNDMLLAVMLAVVGVAIVAAMPTAFLQDTWLALAAGRELWHSGLPHHELLTTFSAGAKWVDEQWLSQLSMYGLWRLGGFGLVGVVSAALIMSGVGAAVVAARRLGASATSVMWLLPLCLWAVLSGLQARTQAYAYPLFALTFYLLASDSRSPSPRVLWSLPLLVLWANVHGSAVLGAGLVSLRGVTVAWERRHTLLRDGRAWRRPAALALAPVACLAATPYGASMVSYYQHTLLNSSFRSFVTEWQPVTSVPLLAAPFFLLMGFALWSFGRHAGRTTLWERCALVALGVGGVMAVRNVQWFGLAALVVVPVSIDQVVRARRGRGTVRRRVNLALALVAALGLIVSVAATLSRSAGSFNRAYESGALRAVAATTRAEPGLRVFADVKFADWLLWNDPQLRGRLAFDARFELLSREQLSRIVHLELASGTDWKRAVRGSRLLVLDANRFPDSTQALERESGARVLFDRAGSVVILRDAAQAGA